MRGSWRPMWGMGGADIQSSHRVSTTQFHKPIQDANLPIRKHCASSISTYFEQQSLQELILFGHYRPMRGCQDTVSGQHLASGRLLLHHCIIIPDRASQTVPGLSRTFLSSWFLFRFLLNVTTCHRPIRRLPCDPVTNERHLPTTSVVSVTVTVGNAVMTPVTSLHSDLFSSRCLILLSCDPGGHNSPRIRYEGQTLAHKTKANKN